MSAPDEDSYLRESMFRIMSYVTDMGEEESPMEVRTRVLECIEGRAFTAVYQPIMGLWGHSVVGFEALTRFADGVNPMLRFQEAQDSGLGVELEVAAIRVAVNGLDALPPDAYLSVNVSVDTLCSMNLVQALAYVPRNRLVLELTEHSPVGARSYPELRGVVKTLRDTGVRLAVDDVGAGFSNFRHILELQPDIIKLDRSLVAGVQADLARSALMIGLVSFANRINTVVVAEGLETKEEFQTVRAFGVPFGQGYLFSRPRPLEMFGSPRVKTEPRASDHWLPPTVEFEPTVDDDEV